MAYYSIQKAQAAFGACLVHLRRLTDSLKPYPSWTDSPDPQRLADTMQEVGPQLLESFAQLEKSKTDGLAELLKARKRMLNKGMSVHRDGVTALGTSGRFYLDIACEKVAWAVGCVNNALSFLDSGGDPMIFLSHLDDTTSTAFHKFVGLENSGLLPLKGCFFAGITNICITDGLTKRGTSKDWNAFINQLELEARDTTTVLSPQQPGEGGAGVEPKKRRGPQKATYQVEQCEAKIAAEWERARDAGTYKGDFARDHGMKTADLELLLGRVRKRKNRAD